jgi:hypothetical protein
VCLAYNLRRLHAVMTGRGQAARPIFLFAALLPLGSIGLLVGIRLLPEGHALLSE